MKSLGLISLALLTCFAAGAASAQPEDLRFGGADTDLGYEVVATPDGGFVTVGFVGSGNLIDGYAVKAAADGSVEWQRTLSLSALPETLYDVLPTDDGGFVLVGGADLPGVTGYRPWLVKLDAAGDEVWNTADTLTLSTEVDSAIVRGTQLASGDFAIMGGTNTMTNPEDPWLLVIDGHGEPISFQQFGTLGTPGFGVSTSIQDLAATADGGFVATGTVFGGLGFAHLWKFDAHGQPVWDRLYGAEGYRASQAVTPLADGGFALAGCDLPNCNNTFVLRTDAQGVPTWFERYESPDGHHTNGRDVLEQPDGSLVVSQTRFRAAGVRFFASDLLELDATGTLLGTWPLAIGTTSTVVDRLSAGAGDEVLGVGSVNDSSDPGKTDLLVVRQMIPSRSGWLFGEDFESSTLERWSHSQPAID